MCVWGLHSLTSQKLGGREQGSESPGQKGLAAALERIKEGMLVEIGLTSLPSLFDFFSARRASKQVMGIGQ